MEMLESGDRDEIEMRRRRLETSSTVSRPTVQPCLSAVLQSIEIPKRHWKTCIIVTKYDLNCTKCETFTHMGWRTIEWKFSAMHKLDWTVTGRHCDSIASIMPYMWITVALGYSENSWNWRIQGWQEAVPERVWGLSPQVQGLQAVSPRNWSLKCFGCLRKHFIVM